MRAIVAAVLILGACGGRAIESSSTSASSTSSSAGSADRDLSACLHCDGGVCRDSTCCGGIDTPYEINGDTCELQGVVCPVACGNGVCTCSADDNGALKWACLYGSCIK